MVLSTFTLKVAGVVLASMLNTLLVHWTAGLYSLSSPQQNLPLAATGDFFVVDLLLKESKCTEVLKRLMTETSIYITM